MQSIESEKTIRNEISLGPLKLNFCLKSLVFYPNKKKIVFYFILVVKFHRMPRFTDCDDFPMENHRQRGNFDRKILKRKQYFEEDEFAL